VVVIDGQRHFPDNGKGIHRCVGLGDELDAGVVTGEYRAKDVLAFNGFAVPAVSAEGFFDREDLE
jgi:hypothetical protein